MGTAAASASPWPRTVEAFNLLISLRSSNCWAFFTLCRSMFKEFAGLMQTRTAHQQIGPCHVPCTTRQSGDAQKEPFSCSCNKRLSPRQKSWRPLQLTCLTGPSSFYLAPAKICKVSQNNTGMGPTGSIETTSAYLQIFFVRFALACTIMRHSTVCCMPT